MAERIIHTKVVWDMETGAELEDESYVYDGPVDECKGGGSSTTVTSNEPDYEYNRRLAAIQERAQELSERYFGHWEETTAPVEKAQSAIKLAQTPLEGEITTGILNIQKNSLPQVAEISKKFLGASAEGVNADTWADRAGNDVKIAANQQNAQMMRNASRYGLNPASGSFTDAMKDSAVTNAAQIAGARTSGFQAAEDENYKRLSSGMSGGWGLYQ